MGFGRSVDYHQLDVSSPESIKSFAQIVKQNHPNGINVLINNAGLNAYPEHTSASVKSMLDLNFRGTRNMCTTFLPLIKENGRIVNLSSTASSLSIYSEEVADRFKSINSLVDAEAIAQEYESLVAKRGEKQAGFGEAGDGYPVSKALVNAITRVLAQSHEVKSKNVLINCCCPGWVNTEMGNIMGKPSKKPIDGARIPVKLAFEDLGGESGKYWANDSVHSTDEGKPLRSW